MKNRLLLWSVIYLVGVLLLVLSGIQAVNWIMYVSIILSIAGMMYAYVMERMQ